MNVGLDIVGRRIGRLEVVELLPPTIDHSSHGGPSTKTASLDRIDSRLGYEPGNIQWVHKDVNQMKWHLSNDRFIEVCRAVVANSGAT